MLRATLIFGLAVVAFAAPSRSLAADTVYYCVPHEPRVTAPDRLVSVEIRLRPNGAFVSVVYRAANGTFIDRSKQYDGTNQQDGNFRYWLGRLRNNSSVGIMGSLRRNNGQLYYFETIHDELQGGKIVAQVMSLCDAGRLDYADVAPPVWSAPPPPVPAQQPPPNTTLSDAELRKFDDCVKAAAVALAAISTEPAQTIVDAAVGECPKERLAFEKALEREGIDRPIDFVDRLTKDVRPNLLALVLNTRASAQSPAQAPAKTEAVKGEPL